MSAAVAHSHRPTTKVTHKPFKSKAASKHELRDRAKGRVPNERGSRKTPHQQVMNKFDRRNQAKQVRISKHKELLKENSVFSGRDGAPRIVAVLPLCSDCDARTAIKTLNSSLDIEVEDTNGTVVVDRFKQKLRYVPLRRDLSACLDATRAADFILVMLSATTEVDELGELILRSVESQGMTTLFTVISGLEKLDQAKQKQGVLGSLKSFITHFHPDQEKLYSLESRQECANLMRSLCSTAPKGIKWREGRSWMLADNIQFPHTTSNSTIVTGVVRGKGLKADRLVQLGDWGTFQIKKIVSAPPPKQSKKKDGDIAIEEDEKVLEEPSEDLDDLNDLAPEDVMMDDDDAMTTATTSKKGVLLDDHHYFTDEDEQEHQVKKKVPKGTSKYQSAWYLDGMSDSGSDLEDLEMQDEAVIDPDTHDDGEDFAEPEPTDIGASEYPQSEMMMDADQELNMNDLDQYRSRKRDEAEDDREFPDEIELHPNVLARERLARYRGLKSLRTSEWQEDEDRAHEPEAWRKLLQVPDYKGAKSRSNNEALIGGVPPGTRVHVYIKGVAPELEKTYDPKSPIALFSLLRHEQKKTAVHYLFNLSTDYKGSIRSKEELIVQCGPRRMVVKPIFSQSGQTPNNVHKYCRYLHPGQSCIATFIGPLTWGALPVLFFKKTNVEERQEEDGPNIGLSLIGTGTALPPSTSRVIAKRVILTGHPYHIHKKVVTIRYMFFNREDVEWFKALPLWTRRGRSGFFKEALGTHGHFKATFDGRINPQDAIGVSLYKRVWPREALPLRGKLLDVEETDQQDADVMME